MTPAVVEGDLIATGPGGLFLGGVPGPVHRVVGTWADADSLRADGRSRWSAPAAEASSEGSPPHQRRNGTAPRLQYGEATVGRPVWGLMSGGVNEVSVQ